MSLGIAPTATLTTSSTKALTCVRGQRDEAAMEAE